MDSDDRAGAPDLCPITWNDVEGGQVTPRRCERKAGHLGDCGPERVLVVDAAYIAREPMRPVAGHKAELLIIDDVIGEPIRRADDPADHVGFHLEFTGTMRPAAAAGVVIHTEGEVSIPRGTRLADSAGHLYVTRKATVVRGGSATVQVGRRVPRGWPLPERVITYSGEIGHLTGATWIDTSGPRPPSLRVVAARERRRRLAELWSAKRAARRARRDAWVRRMLPEVGRDRRPAPDWQARVLDAIAAEETP